MPEMPEVETLRKQLEKVVVGQRIRKVIVLREKSFQGDLKEIEGRVIKEVGRKAKVMWWRLSGGRFLLIHLKMTGQLVYVPREGERVVGGHPTADWVGELPSKHTRVVLELENGRLFFNDMRVFGWMKVVDEQGKEKELSKYGFDVNSKEFTVDYLREVLKDSKRAVKLVLLDQKKIGGLGNIYSNDGLFYAGIDPRKPANEVAKSKQEVRRLWQSLRWVINKGLRYGGASERNYVHLDGLGGEYQNHFLVYGGGRCKKCGGELKKVKLGGRSTWFCPKCQR